MYKLPLFPLLDIVLNIIWVLLLLEIILWRIICYLNLSVCFLYHYNATLPYFIESIHVEPFLYIDVASIL